MNTRRSFAGSALWILLCGAAAAIDNPYLLVSGNTRFDSALQIGRPTSVKVHAFVMQRHPVTNGEFLAFVLSHPEWRRGSAPPVLANGDYLSHWLSPTELGAQAQALQPVTRVSWFAAQAYCEAHDARLPTWLEWEWAAAADPTRRDARSDPAWRQRILDWYARPAGQEPGAVELTEANIHGLHDLHGLVWEWVQDFNSLMSSDEAQKFCGSGGLSMQQKENFAVLMRVAMLSSLRASDTGHALGFRCVRDIQEQTP